jgi:hypothetical protein
MGMTALFITVETPENGQTTYRFEKRRVRIGRRKGCDLSIYHRAMPRELCVAWVEDDACTVRVEERPRLTNPLIKEESIVAGGVSGKRMAFSVGPIKLRFEAGQGNSNAAMHKKNTLTRCFVLAATGAISVALAIVLLGGTRRDPSHDNPFLKLPDTPFCPRNTDRCNVPETCRERARLLITRARDLNSRTGEGRAHGVRAATFLRRAAQLYRLSKSPLVGKVEQEASLAEEAIKAAYRRDVMTLGEAIRRGRKPLEIEAATDRVAAYFGPCHVRERAWLRGLTRLEEL